jgi:integrase
VHREGFNEKQAESGLVFPSSLGGYRSRSVLDKPFATILGAAGIERRFTPHGCRRTAAALYRKVAGSVVSKAIAGHTTDSMHAHYAVVDVAEVAAVGERARSHRRLVADAKTNGTAATGSMVDVRNDDKHPPQRIAE